MKAVVIGGSGLIGSKVVSILRGAGHEVIAASPRSGVNAFTGEGLKQAIAAADLVVDVSNSPSFADEEVMSFFKRSGQNLAAAEKAAGVKHHVALSVVGTDRLPGSGYFRAKLEQERLIKASGVPFTIVRATQFFEFVGAVTEGSAKDGEIRLPDADVQPIAADDVARFVADSAMAPPLNTVFDIAGPQRMSIGEWIGRFLKSQGDNQKVFIDPTAGYFGSPLQRDSLTPNGTARLGEIAFDRWLARATA